MGNDYYVVNIESVANAKTLTIRPEDQKEQWLITNIYYDNTMSLVRVGEGVRATIYTGTVAGAQTLMNYKVTYFDYMEMVNKTTIATVLGFDGEGNHQ